MWTLSTIKMSILTEIEKPQSQVIEQMQEMEHEEVLYFHDKDTGLKGIIAVHDSTLGPSLGGCRIYNYKNESEALWDVLRLSRGMTFKSAISGIDLGGGKSVIISDNPAMRTEKYWRKFGQFVDTLNGKYITAEDVGTSTKEIGYIMQETKHVAGKPIENGGTGDPSPFTAYGVFLGIKATAKKTFGSDNLSGKKIVVQGVGHVGYYLVERLVKEGAVVYIADINETNIANAVNNFGVKVIGTDEVYNFDGDIYAPCAMGATLNESTIPVLKYAMVAGAANNQLANERKHGALLVEKGINYAPDFLINAGGVINCYREVKNLTEKETMPYIENIYNKTIEIFDRAIKEKVTTQEAAIIIAKERIANHKK